MDAAFRLPTAGDDIERGCTNAFTCDAMSEPLPLTVVVITRDAEGYPDWSVRLFDRRHARWSEDTVHEHVLVDGPVGRLRGDLLHASAESLDAYLAKQNRYTTLQAEALFARGQRFSAMRLVL